MASIDRKEKHDAFNSRMEEKQPSTTQESSKNSPRRNSNVKKHSQAQRKGEGKAPATKPYSQGYRIPKFRRMPWEMYFRSPEKGGSQAKISEMISDILDGIPKLYISMNDVKSHISAKNSSNCNNLKTNNLSLSQINDTLVCFEKVLSTIKTSNNEYTFGNELIIKSSIINELTDKYSKCNIYEIIETRIKQAINNIKENYKKVLDDI
ncbi:hypothetical protein O181_071111 [Austropuccinia psidii MF-1]|uniref:Uncharacterized protein n=1 Tax=Austropuccinia psidii MF-1 TaxID=1389203 RepID=A0A9Q3F6P2_9BASI|nr:hypothetical protein [Austropuccinia psidii MF-1]